MNKFYKTESEARFSFALSDICICNIDSSPRHRGCISFRIHGNTFNDAKILMFLIKNFSCKYENKEHAQSRLNRNTS